MKKKLKNTLLLVLTAVAALLVLVGCSFGQSLEDLKEEYNLTAQVTYYANGEFAKFAPNNEKEKDIYYTDNSPVFEITEESGKIQVGYEKYVFAGWYHIATDENGDLITTGEYEYEDEIYKLYELGEAVDFSKRIQSGEHWQIAARWKRDVKVQVQFVYEEEPEKEVAIDSSSITDKDNPLFEKTSIKSGEILFHEEFDNTDIVTEKYLNGSLAKIKFAQEAYTCISYYFDPECTQMISGNIQRDPLQEEDTVIYAKFIEGEWSILKSSDDVEDMFAALYPGARYYLLHDIDYTGITLKPTMFAAELQGNGFAIRNLKFAIAQSNSTASIFQDLKKTAIIENVSFENVSLKITMFTQSANHYFVCSSIEDGAVITNVSVQGTMEISIPLQELSVLNLIGGWDHALFGGFSSDAEYYEKNPNGFKVVGDPEAFIQIIR